MTIEYVKKTLELINQHQEDADFEGSKEQRLIVLAENTLNLKFPESYKFFLQELGCGDIAGQEFFGIIKSDFINSGIPDAIWITLKERYESNLPNNYVVIGETGDGDYIVLDCNDSNDNKVMLWSPGVTNIQIAFKPYYCDFGHYFYDQVSTALSHHDV
jgi:antitoxin YobK